MPLWLFLLPLTYAFACWIIIKLFLTILFHPQKAIRIGTGRIQGVLPANQAILASRIGELVGQHFFSGEMIREKVANPGNFQKILPTIEEHIDDFLRNKLKKEMPFIGMFVGDKTISTLKKVFLDELETLFPKIISGFVSNVVDDINIENLVTQKLNGIPARKIEGLFHKNLAKQIRLAQLVSALVGLIIGSLVMITIYYIK